ncbi:MAG: hypothetical protein NVS3B20_09600 [Polyangiales bacterium]
MASPVAVALRDLARSFEALGVRWFLIGGQAAILYGSTRVTEDIDVTVELGAHTARELVSQVSRRGFSLRVSDSARFVERTRVLPIVHLASSVPVDIVFAGPGLEESFLERARSQRREGLRIPVASPEDIIVMKILAGRPRDVDDIRAVLRAMKGKLDLPGLRKTLAMLEEALGQSDLLPLFAQLRNAAVRRASTARSSKAQKRPAAKRTTRPAKR